MELVKTHSLSFVIALVLVLFEANRVAGSCSFPSDIRGVWERNRDNKDLTFTSTTVSGFGLNYFASPLPAFDCHTISGSKYILVSDFLTTASQPVRYLTCWQLEKVTSSAYILYELTTLLGDANITPDQPGKTQAQAAAVDIGTICDVTTDYFTVLIKDGASSNDVAVQCPSSLFANFKYTQCADSSLMFCDSRTTATADYTSCPTILNSAGGVLSCMGHQESGSYTYVNMFKHDSGNGVTCMRIESGSGGAVSAKYYTGDCSTAGGSSTDLDMTPTKTCPLGDSESDDTGAIVGGTVAVAGVSGVAGLAVLYYFKKKKGKVADVEKPMSIMAENTTTSMTARVSEAPAATATTATATANGSAANGNAVHGEEIDNPLLNGELISPEKSNQPPPIPNAMAQGEPMRA